MNLERTGIFKAIPKTWSVKTTESSDAIAVSIRFDITQELDGSTWKDWSGYQTHHVYGDFWVVKRTGQPLVDQVKNLSEVLGWNGALSSIVSAPPPRTEVQITVDAEEYNGKTYYKAKWLRPGDYTPNFGADADEVKALDQRFGSLLRAAAGKPGKPKLVDETTEEPGTPVEDYGDIPF